MVRLLKITLLAIFSIIIFFISSRSVIAQNKVVIEYSLDDDSDRIVVCGEPVNFRAYDLDSRDCYQIGINCTGRVSEGKLQVGTEIAQFSKPTANEQNYTRTFNIDGICTSGDINHPSGSFNICLRAYDCSTGNNILAGDYYEFPLELVAQQEPKTCNSGYYCDNVGLELQCMNAGGSWAPCLKDDGIGTGNCCLPGIEPPPEPDSCGSGKTCTLAQKEACEDGGGIYVGTDNCNWSESGFSGTGSCCYPSSRPAGYEEWWCEMASTLCVPDLSQYRCGYNVLDKFENFCSGNDINSCGTDYSFYGGLGWGWCKPEDKCVLCYDCNVAGDCEAAPPDDNGWCLTTQYCDLLACQVGCTCYACDKNVWGCYPTSSGSYCIGKAGKAQCEDSCYKCGPLDTKCHVNPSLKIFCNSQGQPTTSPSSGKLYTAIGCIPVTSNLDFAKFLTGWGIGLGGGVAFLLIVYAGFMIMTSGGDPKKLAAGKELLTAAIAGLLLIILGAYLFRLIGVNILGIF